MGVIFAVTGGGLAVAGGTGMVVLLGRGGAGGAEGQGGGEDEKGVLHDVCLPKVVTEI